MTTLNTAIAHHLNVTEQSITKVEEWANCLFTVIKGIGARFVSKTIIKIKTTTNLNGGSLFDIVTFKVGVTDEVTQCDCCGKENLKKTVVFAVDDESDFDRDYAYLGSDCAVKALGTKKANQKVKVSGTVKQEQLETVELLGKKNGQQAKLIAEPDFNCSPVDVKFSFITPTGEQVKIKTKQHLNTLLGLANWTGDVDKLLVKAKASYQIK